MTSRARLSRRPLQVGGLLLATVALGTVSAPAASAEIDPGAPTDQTPEQAPAPAPVVLTDSPISYLGTPEEPVQFGMGKVQIFVAPAADVDAPQDQDMGGAQVEVSFPDEADEETGEVPTITCTTVESGECVFPADSDGPATSLLVVTPWRAYTVTQVEPPTSGLFDLPAGGNGLVVGHGSWTAPSTSATRGAPAVVPAEQASPEDPESEDVTGSITFFDPLAQLSAGQPGGTPVAPGAPAPDPTAAAVPVVPATPAPTAPVAAAPTLATTGFDAVPAALVGGGLLVAGAGAVVAGRRRAAR